METLKKTAPVVDLEQLELFTGGDSEQERMLAAVFQGSGEEAIRILQVHIQNNTPEDAWKNALHRLKGASAQIGAYALSEACRKAQERRGELRKSDKQILLTEIDQRFREVCSFFADRSLSKV